MSIVYREANLSDISELTRMRLDYLVVDYGSVSDYARECIEKQLPDYFTRELGKKLIAFVAMDGDRMIATAFLRIDEVPGRPNEVHGLYGEVHNVYTEPEYRGKGICSKLIESLIACGKEKKLDKLCLEATTEGYPIYKRYGFTIKNVRYTDMNYSYD